MIWQAWATLVLIGTVWSYVAFAQKRATPWSSIATFGFYAVAAFGALGLETQYTSEPSTEVAVAIACAIPAMVGLIVTAAAVTGQYGTPDDDDTPGGGALRRTLE